MVVAVVAVAAAAAAAAGVLKSSTSDFEKHYAGNAFGIGCLVA